MPPVENKRYTVSDFEFPPVDYPNAIGIAYAELKDTANGYGDMKSFMCFDAGFRAALKYVEQKFTGAQQPQHKICQYAKVAKRPCADLVAANVLYKCRQTGEPCIGTEGACKDW